MNDATQQPSKEKRNLTCVVLGISLMLNLLVVGLVIGAKAGGHADKDFHPRGPERGTIHDLGFGPIAGALDREDRRAIGRELRSRHGSFKVNHVALEADLEKILATLRAEDFNAKAFDTVLAAQSDRVRERGASLRDVVVAQINAMSQAERVAFADRIERSIRQGDRKTR